MLKRPQKIKVLQFLEGVHLKGVLEQFLLGVRSYLSLLLGIVLYGRRLKKMKRKTLLLIR
jgi:hypothetical protein